MSFANLKKSKGNNLDTLKKKAAESKSGGGKDPRFYQHTWNPDTKLGTATIRFLPYGVAEGRLPWAEYVMYNFKGTGGFYNERSRRDLGEDDPVAEFNTAQWNRNQGVDQNQVKDRKRKQKYVYDIVVINDPAKPENNGKTFLYRAGPAIHGMITKLMSPDYPDQKPIDPFDLWEGANFQIRTKDKSGWLNYDDSSFEAPAPLHTDDAILEKIYNSMHKLEEFEGEEHYKSYEELTSKMVKVLGANFVGDILGQPVGGAPTQGSPEQPSGTVNDPFAGKAGAPTAPVNDPFAGQAGSPTPPANDPFAGQTGAVADPFAGQAETVAEPEPTPEATPEETPAPTADANDPFANFAL